LYSILYFLRFLNSLGIIFTEGIKIIIIIIIITLL